MRGLASITVLLIVALAQGPTDQRRNWRGIVPLHSTRADVEQLLGPPPPPPKDGTWLYTPNPNMPLYFFADEDVRIGYMTDAFAERMRCSSFPTDTVTGIVVFLKKNPPLSDLGIDESKFETLEAFDASTRPNLGFKEYVDTKGGMYICTQDGKVNEVGYYGDARDRQVCPELNRDPKLFCSFPAGAYDPVDKRRKSKNE